MNKRSGSALKWLGRAVVGEKRYIFFLTVLEVALSFEDIGFALLSRTLVDSAAGGEKELFFRAALWAVLLKLGRILLNAAKRFLLDWTSATLENRLKGRLFSCLLHKSYACVSAAHSEEWMNRLTSDTREVADGFTRIIPELLGMLTGLTGAMVAIFAWDSMFVAVLGPVGIVVLIFTYSFRKVLKRLYKRVREADGIVRVFLQERLGNLMVVRAFAMEEGSEKTAAEKMNAHKKTRMQHSCLTNLCNTAFFGVALNGFYLFGALYCGWGILQGRISYGTMTAVMQLIGDMQSPVAGLTGVIPRYYAMTASAERLMEAESYAEDLEGEGMPQREILRYYQEELQFFGLAHASFRYPEGQGGNSERDAACGRLLLLENVSLEISKGEYVAFTGHSGCGKSTILKLLMCLYPLDWGEVYLTGGGESRPLTAGWRGLFAYVPQGNQLMSGTIREIIAFGDREGMQKEEELKQALEIACADEFVSALGQGLDTRLGERGSGLSEGQMQRIAIARAVFSGHPVLMLDESTSALDAETEKQLLKNLRTMTDRTVLIVTHRPAVLEICDKWVEMTEDGEVRVLQSENR